MRVMVVKPDDALRPGILLYAVEQPDGSFLPRNDAPVVAARNYYEYGVRQKVFLRRGENYFVFVLANLDDRYCPTGDIASFLAQVETYADLKDMYVQAINYSADDVGKMMMSSDNVVHISLDGVGEVYAPTILLHSSSW